MINIATGMKNQTEVQTENPNYCFTRITAVLLSVWLPVRRRSTLQLDIHKYLSFEKIFNIYQKCLKTKTRLLHYSLCQVTPFLHAYLTVS